MNTRWRVIIGALAILITWKLYAHFGVTEIKNPMEDVANVLQKIDDGDKVQITVYYEALCSDSRNFILNQLLPTYNELEMYIKLKLVPYGKARTIEEGGKINFQCQHGPLECTANKIHACVLDKMSSSHLQLKYVACMIDDNIVPDEAGERCATKLNFDYQKIAECADSEKGNLLLKEYGKMTDKVKPQITFIPTIEVDSSQKIPLAHLLKNLKKEICQLLPSNLQECIYK